MKKDKIKKVSSSTPLDETSKHNKILYAESVVPFEKEYYRTTDILIILLVLCIIYVVYDTVKEIFIK